MSECTPTAHLTGWSITLDGRLFFVIAYHLGMRSGEILRLRWDQVDMEKKVVRLELKQTKGKKARIAPIYGDLVGYLEMANQTKAATAIVGRSLFGVDQSPKRRRQASVPHERATVQNPNRSFV